MIIIEHDENHEHQRLSKNCKVCSSGYCDECHPSRFGTCEKQGAKILKLLVVVMNTVSYKWWFAVF
jgi:hypothetical protein